MIKAGNRTYESAEELPTVVPVFPLSGALLLPGGNMPLNIFEPRYIKMIDDALAGEKVLGMIQPCFKAENQGIDPPPLSKIGCLGRITAIQETGDGRYLISLTGISRFTVLEEIASNKPFRTCNIEVFREDFAHGSCQKNDIDREGLLNAFKAYLNANGMDADWDTVDNTDNETLVTALCMMSSYDPAEKQALLEAPDLKTRTETLIAISEMHLARMAGEDNNLIQ